MSINGLSRTVVPHLLQAIIVDQHHWGPTTSYCLWPPFRRGFYYYSLIMIIGLWSGTLSAWSWFSIRVERVGVASSGWGTGAVRIRSSRFAEPLLSERPLTEPSRRTTSTRTLSRLEIEKRLLGERLLGEQLLTNSWTGEQLLGEQLLTNGAHELRRWI